jgi:GT2 family glycosyltransferase
VLGSYDRRRFIQAALGSIRDNGIRVPYEIIVVDGGSTDGTVEFLARQKDVLTIIQHNHGIWRGKPVERRSWGLFMNLAFRAARGEFICMISDDSLLVPGSIMAGIECYDAALREGRRVGAVAFYWRNWPEQKKYWVGLTFGNRMFVNHGLYLKEALEAVGYADEDSYSFYHGDGDLCLRMWEKGYACVDSPDSFVEHYAHANRQVRSTNLAVQKEDWRVYSARWGSLGPPETDWIELEYRDPTRTVDKYWKAGPLRRWLDSLH